MFVGRQTSAGGFTLLELMIVVTILSIIATIGVPQYVSALRTARVGKSKHELVSISHAIDAFEASNGGQLPLTLHQIGFGGKRDPWGVPYCYLNYADGTGDGLEWAIAAGLVDPSAFQGGGGGGGSLPGRIDVRWLRRWLAQEGDGTPEGDKYARARQRATQIIAELPREVTVVETEALVTSIASARSFDLYVGVATETTRRRDRFMFPLNDDYDLFSLGPDGRTSVSLGEGVGLDDVIRANNGGFFGVASEY
jgi:general secretion pathway protein G